MTAEQNRPPWDSIPATIMAHCLKRPADYVEALLCELGTVFPSPENHEWWDRHDPVQDAIQMAKRMGLPHDPNLYQQQDDVARFIGNVLPVHSDRSDDEEEIVVNRIVHPMFVHRVTELLDTLPLNDALEKIRWMAIEINHFYGSNNRVMRESRLQEALAILEWFQSTDGLHDGKSGVVDVEAAAIRAFLKGTE